MYAESCSIGDPVLRIFIGEYSYGEYSSYGEIDAILLCVGYGICLPCVRWQTENTEKATVGDGRYSRKTLALIWCGHRKISSWWLRQTSLPG